MENRYEPCSRFWHSAASAEGLVYIRGGNTADFNSENCRQQLAKTIEQFDPINDIWRQLTTKGAPHPGLSAVACASFGGYLYTFGGFDGEQLHCTLSQLELNTLTWSQLSTVAEDGPMRKDATGMVHFDSSKLAVIGGYGHLGGPIQPGSLFVPNQRFADGTGWTNEIHIFDVHAGSWSSPVIKGTRPPPCADFTLTSIDNHRAVLYGGCRPPEGKCLDKDLYLINFNSMEIIRIEAKPGELWPVVTIGQHAACCLGFNTDHHQLLVSGGRNCHDKCLRDIWKFDLALKQWECIPLPVNTLLPRWGHSATTVVLPDGLTEEVVLFGGSSANYQYSWNELGSQNFVRLIEATVIFFGSRVQAVKSNGQLDILRQNMDLAQFVVEGNFTGRQLGNGYYGTVEEIAVKGLLCAGKKIKLSTDHDAYNFLKECRLISSLHHPNIVQFMGICLHPSSHFPILVMEKLKSQLHQLLLTCPAIPLILKHSVLRDVARGLTYLHPQIIHRDLSAKNILLTPFFIAKICDFGNSWSSDLNGRLQGLTPYPGKRVYMPPETLAEPFMYDCSMDIFSYGHLALFTMVQIFPSDPEPSHSDSCTPYITEVERRGKYFKQLEHESQYFELIQLTKDCLHNHASRRPTAKQILHSLEKMKANSIDTGQFIDAVKQVAYYSSAH